MPAIDATQIANQALSLIGETPVNSLDDGSKAARIMSVNIRPAHRAMLEEYDWADATRRVELTAEEDTPPYGWQFQYRLPADLVRVSAVNEERYSPVWNLENDRILTNLTPVFLRYIAEVDPWEMSSSYQQALVYELAKRAAPAITGRLSDLDRMEQYARRYLEQAMRTDAGQQEDGRNRNITGICHFGFGDYTGTRAGTTTPEAEPPTTDPEEQVPAPTYLELPIQPGQDWVALQPSGSIVPAQYGKFTPSITAATDADLGLGFNNFSYASVTNPYGVAEGSLIIHLRGMPQEPGSMVTLTKVEAIATPSLPTDAEPGDVLVWEE